MKNIRLKDMKIHHCEGFKAWSSLLSPNRTRHRDLGFRLNSKTNFNSRSGEELVGQKLLAALCQPVSATFWVRNVGNFLYLG